MTIRRCRSSSRWRRWGWCWPGSTWRAYGCPTNWSSLPGCWPSEV
ncbi:hypothetical protein NKG94_36420 [Micromonospora sp. M12]